MSAAFALVPKLCLGTPVGKLCFPADRRSEAELPDPRSQAELGNEMGEPLVATELDGPTLPLRVAPLEPPPDDEAATGAAEEPPAWDEPPPPLSAGCRLANELAKTASRLAAVVPLLVVVAGRDAGSRAIGPPPWPTPPAKLGGCDVRMALFAPMSICAISGGGQNAPPRRQQRSTRWTLGRYRPRRADDLREAPPLADTGASGARAASQGACAHGSPSVPRGR